MLEPWLLASSSWKTINIVLCCAVSTESVLCTLYNPQTHFSEDLMVLAASSPVPKLLSKLWFSTKTFHADRFVWFAMYNVVSHPVNAWNANKDAAEPLGSLLNTYLLLPYIIHRCAHCIMFKVVYLTEENVSCLRNTQQLFWTCCELHCSTNLVSAFSCVDFRDVKSVAAFNDLTMHERIPLWILLHLHFWYFQATAKIAILIWNVQGLLYFQTMTVYW